METKSAPSHGKCIPLPSPFEECVVENFHLIEGLEIKFLCLEAIYAWHTPYNYQIWFAMCFLKVKDGHLTTCMLYIQCHVTALDLSMFNGMA